MPILPNYYSTPTIPRTSVYSTPTISRTSAYQESYPSGLVNGYGLSPPRSTTDFSSPYLNPQSTYSPRLPPIIPPSQHARRYTPVRRPYSAGLDVPSQRKPVMFQTRPLKSLTVLSKSPDRSLTRESSRARSPSPTPSSYSVSSVKSSRSSSQCPPRRIFPQTYDKGDPNDLGDLEDKEAGPVVFDANLTFVLGCKGKLRQNVKPVPAHQEAQTASNELSNKISDFLSRTDHVMDEWKGMGHKEDEEHSLRMKRSAGKFVGRSRSATNIMIKGFQYFSRASSCSRSSVARDNSAAEEITEDATEAECDEV